jgi:hypothetical protein
MKLSRILTLALLGTVGFTTSAMAKGTVAGTKISNAPTLTYSMGGTEKKAKAPVASYVVDKVINFTIDLKKAQKQDVAVGKNALGVFLLTNKGNSVESFVLAGNYGSLKDFKFTGSKVYIDKNNNGVLDKAEMKHTPVLPKLAIDGKKTIWIDATTDKKTVIGKGNYYGLLARATARGVKEIYQKQSTKNTMSKVDIVFADAESGGDKIRDNKVINRYIWTTVDGNNKDKLSIKLQLNWITGDPVNGTSKNWKDAQAGKFKAIPGATAVRRWEIKNASKTIAKDVKFSAKIDGRTEKLATSTKNTWWSGKVVQRIDDKKWKILGEGKFNKKTNSVDFTFKEIKPNSLVHAYLVTEIK